MRLAQLLTASLLCWTCYASKAADTLPSGPVADLTGHLLVVNKADHSVSVIDLASGDLVSTISTGRGPHELVVSPDHRHAVVTDYVGGDSLTIISTATFTRRTTVNLSDFPRPHGIAFLDDSLQVIVTSESSENVVLVDITAAQVTGHISVGQAGAHMLALTEDRQFVYTSNMGSDTVSEISLTTRRKVRDFDVPATPEAIAVNVEGTEVWVGSNDTGTLNVITLTDSRVTTVAEGFGWPYRVLFTRSGKVVVPDLQKNVIRVFDAGSYNSLGSLAIPDAGLQGVTLYDDPDVLFVSLNRKNLVAVVDLNSLKILGTYTTGNRPDGIGYLPRQSRGSNL